MYSDIYKKVGDQFVKGKMEEIYLHIPGSTYYRPTPLLVFEDGSLRCADCDIDIATLEAALKSGKLATTVPESYTISIVYNAVHTLTVPPSQKKNNEEFVQYIQSVIESLNEPYCTHEQCRELFRQYLIEGTDATLEHLRTFFATFPLDDQPCFECALSKDALHVLMNREGHYNKAQREYVLGDYFDDQWIVVK